MNKIHTEWVEAQIDICLLSVLEEGHVYSTENEIYYISLPFVYRRTPINFHMTSNYKLLPKECQDILVEMCQRVRKNL